MSTLPLLRFPQGLFPELRAQLLTDSSRETFALLFGQRHRVGEHELIKIVSAHYPRPQDYEDQGLAHLRLKRQYIYDRLVEVQQRGDVDTLIDVHTHPFCSQGAAFSGTDDRDERAFHSWLTDTLDDIHYASIVLSRSDYAARLWRREAEGSVACPARIKTQVVSENWPCAGDPALADIALAEADPEHGFLARSVLALGLDNLRRMTHGQRLAVVGVGGLGSVIAENLIHTGFQALDLIDPDRVEITNLNRIVGAYYQDAVENRLKVEVVRDHLQRINPRAEIGAHAFGVEDEAALSVLAQADWIMLATDSQYSRFKAQEIALRFGIPLISSGVNITVTDGEITDMSGEVIVARTGDRLCLHCLGRINPTEVAAEQHKDDFLGQELVRRGYVDGQDVKEPAVKTLNSLIGAVVVDVLVNQYTLRQSHYPIIVYENNNQPNLYAENQEINRRIKNCFYCS